MSTINRNIVVLLVFTLTLLLLLSPFCSQINFYQNDDYVYYKMVGDFMRGNFLLDSYTSASFYTQGFMGMFFAKVFGLSSLPFLTLLISVSNFFIFSLIVYKQLKKPLAVAILCGLLFFLNPLVIYSSLGFMTETYFLLFFFLSTYFILDFYKENKKVSFFLANLFAILGFLIRQTSIVILGAFCADLLLKKKYKFFFFQTGTCLLLVFFQYFIFPRTPVMYEGSLDFKDLQDPQYIINIFWAIGILTMAFIFPLPLHALIQQKKFVLLTLPLAVVLYFLMSKSFMPLTFPLQQFPYFGNTLDQKGFFPRDLLNEKYHFRGIYDLYYYWEIFSKGLLVLSLAVGVTKLKKHLNVFSLYILFYFLLLLVTPILYDRYLISLFPVFILILISSVNVQKVEWFLLPFVLFLAFLAYQFSWDFVLINKYVWNKSQSLVVLEKVPPYQILATHAWNSTFGLPKEAPNYLFSFDNHYNDNSTYTYKIVESKKLDFPFSFFINPNIYLYKR